MLFRSGDVASDAAKGMAEATVQAKMYDKTVQDMEGNMRDYAEAQGEAALATDDFGNYLNDSMRAWQEERDAALAAKEQTLNQRDAYEKVRDAALEEMEAEQANAEEKKKNAEATAAAARAAETYAAKLDGGMDRLDEMKSKTEYAESATDDFTAALNQAGIDAELLGSVGADAFETIYESANGNLDAVLEMMNILNLAKIDPKHFYVTDDGTVHIAKDQLSDLEKQELRDKGFKVSDDGTIEVMQDKLSMLNRYVANPRVEIDSNIWVLERALDMLHSINGYRATATAMFESFGFHLATGGISQDYIKNIPRHADGGINGIVRRATLTNIGLVGEAGNEYLHDFGSGTAVVPIQNSRYVRPLAQSIAKEMDGMGGNAPSTHEYHITINGAPTDSPEQFARRFTREISRQQRTRA